MRPRLILVALILLAHALPLRAQTVRGTIIDDGTRRPVDNALISLLDARNNAVHRGPIRSDSLGRFMIHAGGPGTYLLRVTRIGYAPLTSERIVLSQPAQLAQLTLAMSADTLRLGRIIVGATRQLTNRELMSYIGYDLRSSKGQGKFFDSLYLADRRRQPVDLVLTDGTPDVVVLRDGTGREHLMMKLGFNVCFPEVWIDGFRTGSLSALARLRSLGADMVYGIEVFSSVQMPPASLAGEIGASQTRVQLYEYREDQLGRAVSTRQRPCGAIGIWTKQVVDELRARGRGRGG
jgi:hypothetical protein